MALLFLVFVFAGGLSLYGMLAIVPFHDQASVSLFPEGAPSFRPSAASTLGGDGVNNHAGRVAESSLSLMLFPNGVSHSLLFAFAFGF